MNNFKQLPASPDIRRIFFSCSIIAGITFIAFLPSINNGFAYWDDDSYVVNNPDIRGFSLKNLVKIFTSSYVGNYQPLTMLSYMTEFHFFQLNPVAYHSTNLILHILNGFLVFILFLGLSRHYRTSLFIAILFAVHPLRVESVAWIAERKDVLFAFFYLLSLLFYVWHTQGKRGVFYWLSLVSFLLSLLSKPMAVTLPVVMFIIDYLCKKRPDKQVLLGKVPFFALLTLFVAITLLTQKKTGDISEYLQLSTLERICVPFYNLFFYIAKTIVPAHLCALYPLPPHLSAGTMFALFASPFFVLGGAAMVYFRRAKSPTLVFGTVFYFITLLPVLQIAPFGNVLVAERYSYIPLLGIYFIFSEWCRYVLTEKINSGILKKMLIAGIGLSTAVFVFITFHRCEVWKDGISLWNDIITKYPIAVAYNFRGNTYRMQNDFNRAIEDFNHAIRLDPQYAQAYDNRGGTFLAQREFDRAIEDYTEAIILDSSDAAAYNNRAIAYSSKGDYNRAINDFNNAIRLRPTYALYNNRGAARHAVGDYKKAIEDFNEAIKHNPNYPRAFYNRGIAYNSTGEDPLAIDDFKKACAMGYEQACQMLSRD